jgi:hypothetical protein
MDNAFVTTLPTRPCPLFGRPVHRRDGSHRFRPGTSPQALPIPPRGGHPALLDFPRGQRGITPAFGYGAPHPSTSGTSTHLNPSLPSAHCTTVRLPVNVHVGLLDHVLLQPALHNCMSGVDGTSRFSRVKFPCMLGVFNRAEPDQCSRFRTHRCCLPHIGTASAL